MTSEASSDLSTKPTGHNNPQATQDDVWVPTVCYMCYNNCGIKVHRQNGVVVKIEGNPDNPHNRGRICAKGNAGIMNLYNPNRVLRPLKRTNPEKGIGVDPQWMEISWEDALNEVAERLKKVRQDDPRKLVITTFDLSVMGEVNTYATAFGTPNSWAAGAGYFCGNGLHPVAYMTTGTFYTEIDLNHCNYLIMIGSQMGFGAFHALVAKAREMADARMRGMKVVIVDPYGTNAASKADEWIPIRPGTDAAFALGMLNVLLNELGIYDTEFIRKHTNGPYLVNKDARYLREKESDRPLIWDSADGRAKPYTADDLQRPALEGQFLVDGVEARPAFELLKEHVKKYTPEYVSDVTTIPAATIRHVAKEFGEAARIGSTIVIDGKELPHRPACVDFSRGPLAHKHGMLNGLAIQLLNIVVGALDVPGGMLGINTAGPSWGPKEGPDGLIAPDNFVARSWTPYPIREPKLPETLELMELLPFACYGRPVLVHTVMDPKKFKLPYEPEMMIHCRTNVIVTTTNPKEVAEVLKKFKFFVSVARELDETTEFADIVFPDTHYLERLDPFTETFTLGAISGYRYHQMAQPVVEPPAKMGHWFEILLELADRAGFLSDFYVILNTAHRLADNQRLDPKKKYTWQELGDHWAKSSFGEEHGVDWFKKNSSYSKPKRVEETYPRAFTKYRIPLYFEFFPTAAEKIKRVTEEMGIDWDISDYEVLPDWKPCPTFEDKTGQYDLIAINYKLPFHTFSYTAENPWLDDLAQRHPHAYNICINSEIGQRKGINNGDEIVIESKEGRTLRGKVRLSECVHPEVVAIGGCFNHWAKSKSIAKGKGVHFNELLTADMEHLDTFSTAVDSCIRVRVHKA